MQVLLQHLKAMILTPKQDMCFWIEICAGTDCTRLKDNVASKKKSPRGTDDAMVCSHAFSMTCRLNDTLAEWLCDSLIALAPKNGTATT